MFAPDGLYYSVDDYYDDLKALDDYPMHHYILIDYQWFFAKNLRFNVFFHRLSPNRGKKGKNSLFRSRQTPFAKIGHVGVYFAKKSCKIEDGFMDIFRLQSWNLVFGQSVILLGFNNTRSTNKFCSQKKKAVANFAMAQPSLFFP